MLGRSDPNGNGRLALALVDSLLKHLVASGVLTQADLDALSAETHKRLEAEHSITSEGALSVLDTSKLGS
jgi:hypothetical protein